MQGTRKRFSIETGHKLINIVIYNRCIITRWLVGCFGFNGPLRQYFSLYRAVSQREGEREENG